MKLQFTLVINGGESLERKFENSIKSNPDLNLNLVQGFGQILTLAFGFNVADGITVDSLRVCKIPDESKKSSEIVQEQVKQENAQQNA
jgi:hypothetical protein